MTDPVTNVEIEDVLSSIRRLVSEKAQPEMRSDDRGVANDFAAPDRLVLTQALRVPAFETVPEVPVAVLPNATVEPAIVTIQEPRARAKALVEVVPKADDAPVSAADIAPETAEAGAVDDDDLTSDLVAVQADAGQAVGDREISVQDDVSAVRNLLQSTLGQTEGQTEKLNGLRSKQAQTDVVSDNAAALPANDISDSVDRLATAIAEKGDNAAARLSKPAEAEVAGDDTVNVLPRSSGDELASRIAEWEAVIANTDEQFEPDGTGADDYAGTEVESLSWRDHSDPVTERLNETREAIDRLDAATEADHDHDAEDIVVEAVASEVAESFPGVTDDAYIDEDALRDLVGDIVRQELQGALGERITRNVRKLVRREIHRALSAGGLE